MKGWLGHMLTCSITYQPWTCPHQGKHCSALTDNICWHCCYSQTSSKIRVSWPHTITYHLRPYHSTINCTHLIGQSQAIITKGSHTKQGSPTNNRTTSCFSCKEDFFLNKWKLVFLSCAIPIPRSQNCLI